MYVILYGYMRFVLRSYISRESCMILPPTTINAISLVYKCLHIFDDKKAKLWLDHILTMQLDHISPHISDYNPMYPRMCFHKFQSILT